MVDEEMLINVVGAVGAEIGNSVGNLLVIATLQARAMTMLSNALKDDPNVSEETKKQAAHCLAIVDLIIENLEKAAGENSLEDLRDMLGKKK